jgi:polygalacturonase
MCCVEDLPLLIKLMQGGAVNPVMLKILVLLGLFSLVHGAFAQDLRHVIEPTLPAACVSLRANLHLANGGLAPADENKLDTTRIQQALDACGKGQAVVLSADGTGRAFLSGPLVLRDGVTLIVDRGVVLFASRDPAAYAVSPGSCGVVNDLSPGCKPLIFAQQIDGAGVMGDGVIDGRGGEKLLGQTVSWWELAEQARKGGRQQVPRLIVTDHANNFTLYRITMKNSPNFHVVFNHGDGLTVWGLKIDTPKRLARNTDGVDPGQGSKNITITHSFIRTGDDNVAIKGGPGGVTNMTVSHDHFYWGHGMSIGSETNGGVSAIRVLDLSLDGPDNGIRIKSNGSRGGVVEDVSYDDVCIRDSPNPIILDTGYTAAGTPQGDFPPTFRDITFHDMRIFGGGKFSFDGYDKQHRVSATLDDVLEADGAAYTDSLVHADLHLGPGPVNLRFGPGIDSTIQGVPRNGSPESCADKFVKFPAD